MVCRLLLLLLLAVGGHLSLAASPFVSMYDEEVEEGEYSVLYPKLLVCLLARNTAHSLPYFFGLLEEQSYPKDRTHLFIRTDHNLDETAQAIEKWIASVDKLYGSIDFRADTSSQSYADEDGPLHWSQLRYENMISLKEEALLKARRFRFGSVLFIDADQFLVDSRSIVTMVEATKLYSMTVVAPVMHDIVSNYSNFWGKVGPDGYYAKSEYYHRILTGDVVGCNAVPVVHSTFLIDLNQQASQLLTFDHNNLPYYDGAVDDILIFTESARRGAVPTCALNTRQFGYLLSPGREHDGLGTMQRLMRHLVSDLVSTQGPPGLLYSPHLTPRFPVPHKFGYDKVYMINLARRPDRRQKMDLILKLLGVEYEWVTAVDGYNLTVSDLRQLGINQLPSYLDPYHKRPMTMGEVGCFLSHYIIWKDVIDRHLNKVLVFEDDLRLDAHFSELLEAINEDLESTGLSWDLIYLGRKRLEGNMASVAGHRFLTEVGYTYWTLAYLLSASGAEKLLAAAPLEKLVPVDEYLPIMYDRHPRADWTAAFGRRQLRAFTAEPLLAHPAFYTAQPGYVSDTETSQLLSDEFIPSDDADSVAQDFPQLSVSLTKDEL